MFLLFVEDFQQVLVADEAKERESVALPIQVLALVFLNLAQLAGERFQSALDAGDVEHVHDSWAAGNCRHKSAEFGADALETRSDAAQNVGTAAEDPVEEDPPALDVDPDVEKGAETDDDLLEADETFRRVFRQLFVVGREFHCGERSAVHLHHVDQVIQAADDKSIDELHLPIVEQGLHVAQFTFQRVCGR